MFFRVKIWWSILEFVFKLPDLLIDYSKLFFLCTKAFRLRIDLGCDLGHTIAGIIDLVEQMVRSLLGIPKHNLAGTNGCCYGLAIAGFLIGRF